jgi:ribonuclease P protein component
MLSKENKLSREQFDLLLKQRQKKTPTLCGLFSYIQPTTTSFHCAVVISKKIAKKAHERNYAKRVLYTILRKYTHLPFFGYLLVSKEGYTLIATDRKKLEESIYEFFQKYPQR